MYVGEGEQILRDVFARARLAAPSIIFIDELDGIASRRSAGGGGGGDAAGERLLATLLTEMDGLEAATGVLLLAATNRPEAVDAALLRPGRLDLVLYVPPPDQLGRLQALQVDHHRNHNHHHHQNHHNLYARVTQV
jgi:SpoVK/Ycf46/Vps4 family AAA+-type ATPase